MIYLINLYTVSERSRVYGNYLRANSRGTYRDLFGILFDMDAVITELLHNGVSSYKLDIQQLIISYNHANYRTRALLT